MRILFNSDPLNPKKVDLDYEEEYFSARNHGFVVHLFSYEELVDFDNANAAIKNIPLLAAMEPVLYRGWMMKPATYNKLYQALLRKNLQLINAPEQYKNCHYFPESYDWIKDFTPRSVWMQADEIKSKLPLILQGFLDKSVVIKDYVKSRKHEWFEAFYIPRASDTNAAKTVVDNFVKRQGAELNEGLVVREFVELDIIANHPISGMPLANEFRIFFLHGKPLSIFHYWNVEYDDSKPNLKPFLSVAKSINSNFFTMDIAKTKDGHWIVMELGDGQVSGFPENIVPDIFFKKMKEAFSK